MITVVRVYASISTMVEFVFNDDFFRESRTVGDERTRMIACVHVRRLKILFIKNHYILRNSKGFNLHKKVLCF